MPSSPSRPSLRLSRLTHFQKVCERLPAPLSSCMAGNEQGTPLSFSPAAQGQQISRDSHGCQCAGCLIALSRLMPFQKVCKHPLARLSCCVTGSDQGTPPLHGMLHVSQSRIIALICRTLRTQGPARQTFGKSPELMPESVLACARDTLAC